MTKKVIIKTFNLVTQQSQLLDGKVDYIVASNLKLLWPLFKSQTA